MFVFQASHLCLLNFIRFVCYHGLNSFVDGPFGTTLNPRLTPDAASVAVRLGSQQFHCIASLSPPDRIRCSFCNIFATIPQLRVAFNPPDFLPPLRSPLVLPTARKPTELQKYWRVERHVQLVYRFSYCTPRHRRHAHARAQCSLGVRANWVGALDWEHHGFDFDARTCKSSLRATNCTQSKQTKMAFRMECQT